MLVIGGLLLILVQTMSHAQVSTNPVNTMESAETNATVLLKQYLADFKDTTNGPALDEMEIKIIKLAKTMNPKPKIPEEAREHFIKAGVFCTEAKEASDYDLAATEYLQARNLAPWWPEVYSNLASVRETEKHYDAAIRDFKIYLASNPSDTRAIQDRLYKLEAEKMLATKHSADGHATP